MNNKISNLKQNTINAYNKGYRVINNICYNPKGKEIKGSVDTYGYKLICKKGVKVHQLVAYQKYKDIWLYGNLIVRHLDNNKLNNNEENIELGTHVDNMNDIPIDVRKKRSIIGLTKARENPIMYINVGISARERFRKCSDAQVLSIRQDREKGLSYGILSNKYNIPKSTIKHICAGRTYRHLL